MKIIIDSYRGGNDTGEYINNQYEKNILLELSKYLSETLNNQGISTELVRTTDISLTDDERISIINELKEDDDIIIQNRYLADNLEIVYPLRNNDNLPSQIANNLENNGIIVEKYYQRRLPTNTMQDYYSIIRNTSPNETLIIEYNDLSNYKDIVDIISSSITNYINKSNTYTVKSGDTLYKIASKYNTTVSKLKELNNLTSNNLSIGQTLILPSNSNNSNNNSTNTYTVKSGDTLYKIASKYNTTVNELKELNNLVSNNLSIGQTLILPSNSNDNSTNTYTVKSGDTLYKIASKYNTTVNELKELNNLVSNNLSIGQMLILPSNDDTYIIYYVKSGDTLYSIAKNYNITVDEIKKLNNLTTNLLNVNQELKIPR